MWWREHVVVAGPWRGVLVRKVARSVRIIRPIIRKNKFKWVSCGGSNAHPANVHAFSANESDSSIQSAAPTPPPSDHISTPPAPSPPSPPPPPLLLASPCPRSRRPHQPPPPSPSDSATLCESGVTPQRIIRHAITAKRYDTSCNGTSIGCDESHAHIFLKRDEVEFRFFSTSSRFSSSTRDSRWLSRGWRYRPPPSVSSRYIVSDTRSRSRSNQNSRAVIPSSATASSATKARRHVTGVIPAADGSCLRPVDTMKRSRRYVRSNRR